MTRDTRELLDQALQLPLDERARLAADLLASLDGVEDEIKSVWAAEIERRVAAMRAGEVGSSDWRVLLDQVEKVVLGG